MTCNCGRLIYGPSRKCDTCIQASRSAANTQACALIGGLIALALFLLWARGSANSTASVPSNAPARVAPVAQQAPLVMVEQPQWGQFSFNSDRIIGVAENRSGKTLAYAQVVFPIFDQSHNQVGSALANINNLAPNARWKFEAYATESTAHSFGAPEFTAY
jgi:hypothetical protein